MYGGRLLSQVNQKMVQYIHPPNNVLYRTVCLCEALICVGLISQGGVCVCVCVCVCVKLVSSSGASGTSIYLEKLLLEW